MSTPRITTAFWAKPIPTSAFDWLAHYDGDEPNDDGQMVYGSGRTEAEAVLDLIDNHPRGYPDCEREVAHG